MENATGPSTETADGEHAADPRGVGIWQFLPLAVLVSGLVAGYAAGLHQHMSLETVARSRETLIAAVGGSSLVAALAYSAFCFAVTGFGFPAPSALAVFGGLLFGWVAGALLALAGAVAGATLMFLAARLAFGGALRPDPVVSPSGYRRGDSAALVPEQEARAPSPYGRPRQRSGQGAARMSARLARGFERDAFTYLVALRLAPYIPFIAVNIAPALFRVRLATFIGATALGMLPLITIFAWLGEGVDDALAGAAAAGRQLTPADLVTPEVKLALSVLALVAVLVPVGRRLARRRSPPETIG